MHHSDNNNNQTPLNNIGLTSNLILSGLGGMMSYGAIGSFTSLGATIVDEYLISKRITNKHHLTTTALWSSILIPSISCFTPLGAVISVATYGLSIGIGFAISHLSNDPLNYHVKIKEIEDNLGPVVKLFDSNNKLSYLEFTEVYNSLLQNPIEGSKKIFDDLYYISQNKIVQTILIINVCGLAEALIMNHIVKLLGNNAFTKFSLSIITANPNGNMYELAYKTGELYLYLSLQKLTNISNVFFQEYIKIKVNEEIEKKVVTQILLNEEFIPKIISLDKMEEVTLSLTTDFCKLYDKSVEKLIPLTVNNIKGLTTLSFIINLAPESLIFAQFTGYLLNFITNYVNSEIQKLTTLYLNVNLDSSLITTDIVQNFSQILFTKSHKLVQDKFLTNIDSETNLKNSTFLLSLKKTIFLEGLEVLTQLFGGIYYSYKILIAKTLPFEDATTLYLWQNSTILLLNGGTFEENLDSNSAKENISKVLEVINQPYIKTSSLNFNNNSIININDYEIFINNCSVLYINDLTLEQGKHYAVSGKSGVGKTSLLKGICGYLLPPFSDKGEISLPIINGNKAKIVFIDQTLYVPPTVSLLEAITLISKDKMSKNIQDEYEKNISNLLEQLNFFTIISNERYENIPQLLNENFEQDKFSSGQIKIFSLIKAIILKPDILFLDETLTNMDDVLLSKIQQLLTIYLPNTIIVTIDHKAQSNNFNNFYDYWIDINQAKGVNFLDLKKHYSDNNHFINFSDSNINDLPQVEPDIWFDALSEVSDWY